jgi:hypothetical protein
MRRKCKHHLHFRRVNKQVIRMPAAAPMLSAPARIDAFRPCFAGEMRRTGVHTSLSGVAFFSLCCSNRSAVHVDSRLHCSDNRHLTNGLGGQHGEEGSYEVEDQVCVEEDSDEDQGEVHRQKEEVRQRSTFDFEECRCVRHTSRRLELGSASAQPGHRRLSDDEGVGETEGSNFAAIAPATVRVGEERDGKPPLAIGKTSGRVRTFRSRRRPRFIFGSVQRMRAGAQAE